MNVSMQDAFNLGWKLASVLEGRARPELLRTYSAERHAIAQGLIDFDKEWSKIMASPPKDPSRPELGGVDPAELQAYFVKSGRYTAGVATHYPPTTVLTAEATHQAPRRGLHDRHALPLGARRAPRRRQADAARPRRPCRRRAGASTPSPTRADSGCASSRTSSRSRRIRRSAASRPTGARHRQRHRRSRGLPAGHRDLKVEDLPSILLPRKGRFGLIDYEKAYRARPQERPATSSTCAASTASRARWSSFVPTSTSRTCSRWTRTTSSPPSSGGSCSTAQLDSGLAERPDLRKRTGNRTWCGV